VQEKWSGDSIDGIGYLLVAAYRTSAGPREAFPFLEGKAAFPATRWGHHKMPFLPPGRLTDMGKMKDDLFFRYPHLCGYLPGRKGALLQQGDDRLPDGRVFFAGNKRAFCFHFLYFPGKIYYILKAVKMPNPDLRKESGSPPCFRDYSGPDAMGVT
jgi:hypothetical protein